MWTPQRRVRCVLWLAELKSVTRVQRRARREWNVDPPTCKSIYEWDKTLRETGSLFSHAGKILNSAWRKRLWIVCVSHSLGVPRSTVHTLFTNVSVCVLTNFKSCITLTAWRTLTVWRRNYFFLILAHPVYKMWIIQEPNMLELWNKLHFEEEKKNGQYTPCLKYSVPIFVE